jgi:type III secretion protein V
VPYIRVKIALVLSAVFDQRTSIADRQAVAGVLGLDRDHSPEDAAEDLLAALRPKVVAIHIPREYLQQLTTADGGQGGDLVPAMRKDLFTELEMQYPLFRFVGNEGLKPGTFAFQINHLMTLPFLGLQPGECLVNDTVERLRLLNVQARRAENPVIGQPSSIVNAEYKPMLEAAGLITWDPIRFFILCFTATLRKYGAFLLDRETVDAQLEQLRLAFPTLVEAARARWPVEQITGVLRALASEEISIRNLRQILERLLDFDFRTPDSSRYLVLDDRPYTPRGVDGGGDAPSLVSFVRAGLKREVGHKYARGTNTLVAYVLDAEIEALVSRQQKAPTDDDILDERDFDRIAEAIQTEIALLPSTAEVPVILTTETARPRLRELMAAEFPRVSVVSYTELVSELNVQPVARISLK